MHFFYSIRGRASLHNRQDEKQGKYISHCTIHKEKSTVKTEVNLDSLTGSGIEIIGEISLVLQLYGIFQLCQNIEL